MPDFGRASSIEPEAIGQPGQRTFRLRIQAAKGAASLWLEKEQLAALANAFRDLLEQARADVADQPEGVSEVAGFPEDPDVEFKIGRLGLGYDDKNNLVVLLVHAVDEEEEAQPNFSCKASFQQCDAFAKRAEDIVAAGRPICTACGLPINADGHQCGRRNGHEKLPISLA
jgi:uncharacterized repeat protein (TIGR03847 family)